MGGENCLFIFRIRWVNNTMIRKIPSTGFVLEWREKYPIVCECAMLLLPLSVQLPPASCFRLPAVLLCLLIGLFRGAFVSITRLFVTTLKIQNWVWENFRTAMRPRLIFTGMFLAWSSFRFLKSMTPGLKVAPPEGLSVFS